MAKTLTRNELQDMCRGQEPIGRRMYDRNGRLLYYWGCGLWAAVTEELADKMDELIETDI